MHFRRYQPGSPLHQPKTRLCLSKWMLGSTNGNVKQQLMTIISEISMNTRSLIQNSLEMLSQVWKSCAFKKCAQVYRTLLQLLSFSYPTIILTEISVKIINFFTAKKDRSMSIISLIVLLVEHDQSFASIISEMGCPHLQHVCVVFFVDDNGAERLT